MARGIRHPANGPDEPRGLGAGGTRRADSWRRCAWFEPYEPTPSGKAFLTALWRQSFGDDSQDVEWFVSEYELPVPPAWRADTPFTYRCPDFACGNGSRVFIVELKTERGSYQPRQMADYLRLTRYKLPDHWTDLALLGPHRPGATPAHDERQRYAELTWAGIPDLLRSSFPGDNGSARLCAFLAQDLALAAARPRKPTRAAGARRRR